VFVMKFLVSIIIYSQARPTCCACALGKTALEIEDNVRGAALARAANPGASLTAERCKIAKRIPCTDEATVR
jgi:hypothetical protein